jgi:hypothetical protein
MAERVERIENLRAGLPRNVVELSIQGSEIVLEGFAGRRLKQKSAGLQAA